MGSKLVSNTFTTDKDIVPEVEFRFYVLSIVQGFDEAKSSIKTVADKNKKIK